MHVNILNQLQRLEPRQGLLGQKNFNWTLRRWEGGGGGVLSDLNVQLTFSGNKVNMNKTQTAVTNICLNCISFINLTFVCYNINHQM